MRLQERVSRLEAKMNKGTLMVELQGGGVFPVSRLALVDLVLALLDYGYNTPDMPELPDWWQTMAQAIPQDGEPVIEMARGLAAERLAAMQ